MKTLRHVRSESRGFTLVEALVAIGIMTIVMSIMGSALYTALGTQQGVVDDGLAINELRKGLGWLGEDVKMANSTNVIDGGSTLPILVLTWTDEFNGAAQAHTITYSLNGDRLVRDYDGSSHTIARRVDSAEFFRTGQVVTAEFGVDAGGGTIRTLSVTTLMRVDPGS